VAYAFVQSVEGSRVTSGTTISATYTTQNVTAGNLLVAIIGVSVASGQPSSIGQVTDNQGNYWKQAEECENFEPYGVNIWYCEKAGGGNKPTVTATMLAFPTGNSINGMNMLLLEYSGNSGRELMDTTGEAGITTTSVTLTTTANLAGTGDLLISAVTGNMSAATIPSSSNSRLADTTQHLWVADLIGPSSGSQASAAWTGLTGGSQGAGVIVCFRTTGTAGPTLLQSSYTNAAYPVASPLTSWTSQAYPVNPTAGNTLMCLCSGIVSSPFQSTPALTCTGSNASDKWLRIQDSGKDTTSGVNLCLWVCPTTLGGSSYTVTVTFPFQSAGFSCLLLEFNGLNLSPASVDQAAGIAGGSNNQAWSISTPANVQAGSTAICAMASLLSLANNPSVGWTVCMSDSAGSNWVAMQLSTAEGALSCTWGGHASLAATDLLIAAIRPSPGGGVH